MQGSCGFPSQVQNRKPLLLNSSCGVPAKALLRAHGALQSPRGFREDLPAAGVEPLGLQIGETTLPGQEIGRADPVGRSPPHGSWI